MRSVYLRDLATRCRDWSRDCFDLRAAERLRLVADELADKANELELPSVLHTHTRQQPVQQQQSRAGRKNK
jgi:hypothetical protein